jgi:FKBP-type peptidyl-prolyl cis-trans isomerase FkpA
MTIALGGRAARAVLTVGLLVGVAGCFGLGDSTNTTTLDDGEFAPSLGIDLATMNLSPSGLYWIDTQVGTGDEAVEGLTATVQFSGWLRNGVLFDTGEFTFFLDPETNVIAGFLEGTLGMKVEGVRKLVVPPHLAWGPEGNGVIPPNATVVFQIELLNLE